MNIESVKERIALLEAAGELSIKESFYLEAMKELCESQAQVKKLAAENAALKEANGIALKILNDEETMVTSLWASSIQKVEAQTPATDSILASLRAEGVEMVLGLISHTKGMLYADSVKATLSDVVANLRSQSEQVKGVQS